MEIVIPILAGLAAGAIAVLIVVVDYKKKLKSPIYPLSKYASLDLSLSQDNYLSTSVTRVRVQSSSSGNSRNGR